MKKFKPLVWLVCVLMVMSIFVVAACKTEKDPGGTPGVTDPKPNPKPSIPEPNKNGVVTADMWKEGYPDIYASYEMNRSNSDAGDYLVQAPYLITNYSGSGFAKDYKEARGHPFTLQDASATERPHALANCLTCKSPEFNAFVNKDGVGMYSKDFGEIFALVTEPVSCYSCHANTGDELVVIGGYLNDALGSDKSKVAAEMLACGQCHNEYYFDPATKAVTLPWTGLDKMNPDDMLAYYNSMSTPFVDFVNPISGAGMLKVQHPELETVMGSGSKIMAYMDFSCSDCHMGTAKNSAGEEYVSHFFQSPLKNADMLANSCNTLGCHTDIVKQTGDLQKKVKEREKEVGLKIASLHEQIGAAVAAGSKTDAELAELRSLVRDAQWYWDFVRVENSHGAHNSTFALELLSKAEKLADQGLAKLK